MKEGYDVVSGWRKNRKDNSLSRVIPSKIANYIISKISGVSLHDYGCTLKAYKKDVIKDIKLYGEMHGNSTGHFIKSENHQQNKLDL